MDVDKLKAIVAALEGTEITRFIWRSGEEQLIINRGAPAPVAMAAPAAAAPAPLAASGPASDPRHEGAPSVPGHVVSSPFVGTFYRASSPEAPVFVEVGQVVKKGQTLCIVEAMKLMNEIEAEVPGRIAEILAENGQAVEFGQSLFRVEPA